MTSAGKLSVLMWLFSPNSAKKKASRVGGGQDHVLPEQMIIFSTLVTFTNSSAKSHCVGGSRTL